MYFFLKKKNIDFFCALFYTECKMPMGLSTGVISDSQIKASGHLSK